jgi:hypothetical protein
MKNEIKKKKHEKLNKILNIPFVKFLSAEFRALDLYLIACIDREAFSIQCSD